jgi:hypothetical protein
MYLAFDGEELIGMRGIFPWLWQAGTPARRFALPAAGDTVVYPAHRRKGMFGVIMTHVHRDLHAKGHDYVVNMSAGEVTATASRKIGWRHLGSYEFMQRPGAKDRGTENAAFDGDGETASLPGNVRLADRPDPQAMSGLVARLPADGRIALSRTRAFFAWRFDNPICEYRFLFREGDNFEGYLVLQRTPGNLGTLNIVDWESSGLAVKEELLEAAVRLAGPCALSVWTMSLGRDDLAILERAGFARIDVTGGGTRMPRGLLVKRLAADADPGEWTIADRPALDPASWNLQMICSDGA